MKSSPRIRLLKLNTTVTPKGIEQPKQWCAGNLALQNNDAPVHSVFLFHSNTLVTPQLFYSLDLFPFDFFLIPKSSLVSGLFPWTQFQLQTGQSFPFSIFNLPALKTLNLITKIKTRTGEV